MTEKKKLDPITDVMMKSVFIIVIIAAVAPMLQKMFSGAPSAQALQAVAYQGVTDHREVYVDDRFIWLDLIHDYPYRPWIHAYFINDGPGPVEIGINHPSDRGVLAVGETWIVDRAGAEERMNSIFFVCPHGQKALVRITGEY